MNDFTKEELETIYASVDIISVELDEFHENERLLNKIQSMIDNYCEHDWENICCQCTLDNIYCYKCEKSFDEY